MTDWKILVIRINGRDIGSRIQRDLPKSIKIQVAQQKTGQSVQLVNSQGEENSVAHTQKRKQIFLKKRMNKYSLV